MIRTPHTFTWAVFLTMLCCVRCLAASDLPAQTANTFFVPCPADAKDQRVSSPVSLSEGGKWRAYVEVDIRFDHGSCLQTATLWAADLAGKYRLLYLMPPQREAVGDGIEILGWAPGSRLVLLKTNRWQDGSDALPAEQVVAIDAKTGLVYNPDLESMLSGEEHDRCAVHILEAGFRDRHNIEILVRAKIVRADQDPEPSAAIAKLCGERQELWSFEYGNGRREHVPDEQPLLLYKSPSTTR